MLKWVKGLLASQDFGGFVCIGSRDSLLVRAPDFTIERLPVRIPAGAGKELSSPELTLRADSYFGSVPPPCYCSGT